MTAYRNGVHAVLDGNKWDGLIPALPAGTAFDVFNSRSLPGGSFLVALVNRPGLSTMGLTEPALYHDPNSKLPLIICPKHTKRDGQWDKKVEAILDHESVHVLQALRGEVDTETTASTPEHAYELIAKRIQLELDAYFVQHSQHPDDTRSRHGLANVLPRGESSQPLALWRAYLSGIEDASSGAWFDPGLVPQFFTAFVTRLPEDLLAWGLTPETVTWWSMLPHAHHLQIAWDRMQTCRDGLRQRQDSREIFNKFVKTLPNQPGDL